MDKAVELLLSFKWIEEKLRATGAPDLINSYHKVIKLVQDDVSMLAKILFVPLEAKGGGSMFPNGLCHCSFCFTAVSGFHA